MELEKTFQLAVDRHRQGSFSDAERLYRQLMASAPENPAAFHMLALLKTQQGNHTEALALIVKALSRAPNNPIMLACQTDILTSLGRPAEALARLGKAGRPLLNSAEVQCARARALNKSGRHSEALLAYDRALAVSPSHVAAQYHRGSILWALHRFEEALASYDAVIAIQPALAAAHSSRGLALWQLRRFDEALASFDHATKLAPDLAEAWSGRGNVLWETNQVAAALQSFDRALFVKPDLAEALNGRANALQMLKRYSAAISDYEKVIALTPHHPYAPGGLAMTALCLCDWSRVENIRRQLPQLIKQSVFPPFAALIYSDDSRLLRECSERNIRGLTPILPAPLWHGECYRHDRIRIGYMSANFGQHPVTAQIVDLLERHDRTKFEIIGVSLGADDGSKARFRLANGCDQFLDLREKSYRTVAEKLRAMEIDILVELGGHTTNAPLEVLSHRPAPCQVTWLGYAGTTGADFVDYIIADRVVVPESQVEFFSEKIAYLPDTFFPADTKRTINNDISRRDVGLPEGVFVFCCFNNSWKITATIFAVWMELLADVPSSVLWLKSDAAEVADRLRRAAEDHGNDPSRLIFADRVESDADHLGRQRLADLFLDTLPYNAHATGCDALWAGLPIITCRGRSFAGRVSASLLAAAGLPELVADTLDGYKAIALKLAQEPDTLAAIRAKLRDNRPREALFDADRFRQAIEAAYDRMHALSSEGREAQSFSVQL